MNDKEKDEGAAVAAYPSAIHLFAQQLNTPIERAIEVLEQLNHAAFIYEESRLSAIEDVVLALGADVSTMCDAFFAFQDEVLGKRHTTPLPAQRALAMLQSFKNDISKLSTIPTYDPDYDRGYEVGLVDGARQILATLGLLKED